MSNPSLDKQLFANESLLFGTAESEIMDKSEYKHVSIQVDVAGASAIGTIEVSWSNTGVNWALLNNVLINVTGPGTYGLNLPYLMHKRIKLKITLTSGSMTINAFATAMR